MYLSQSAGSREEELKTMSSVDGGDHFSKLKNLVYHQRHQWSGVFGEVYLKHLQIK